MIFIYYIQCSSANGAGKQFETAASTMVSLGEFDAAVQYFMKAQEMYRINGHHAKAAEVLTKAGKFVSSPFSLSTDYLLTRSMLDGAPEKTFDLFQTAVEIYTVYLFLTFFLILSFWNSCLGRGSNAIRRRYLQILPNCPSPCQEVYPSNLYLFIIICFLLTFLAINLHLKNYHAALKQIRN